MKPAFSTLLIGLDNSGKTTLIQSLKNSSTEIEILPTANFQTEILNYPKLSKPILIIDCSGSGIHRSNWKIFYSDADSVIFVIDATDVKRITLTKQNIDEFMTDPGKYDYQVWLYFKIQIDIEKRDIPIVFALNKCDVEEAYDRSEELKIALGLDKWKKHNPKRVYIKYYNFVFSDKLQSYLIYSQTSGYTREGVHECFDYINTIRGSSKNVFV